MQNEFWTEVAYVFLSVAYDDQVKFEQQFKDLTKQITMGRRRHKHNWVAMLSGTRAERRYGVLGFPYRGITRDGRNDMMKHMAAEFEGGPQVFGTVVLGIDIEAPHYPYDALMYVPGHAPGATDFGHVVLPKSGRSGEPDFDFHLKSPRRRS